MDGHIQKEVLEAHIKDLGFHPPMNPGEKNATLRGPEQGGANGSSIVFRYLVRWCCSPYTVRSEDQAGSSVCQGRK